MDIGAPLSQLLMHDCVRNSSRLRAYGPLPGKSWASVAVCHGLLVTLISSSSSRVGGDSVYSVGCDPFKLQSKVFHRTINGCLPQGMDIADDVPSIRERCI